MLKADFLRDDTVSSAVVVCLDWDIAVKNKNISFSKYRKLYMTEVTEFNQFQGLATPLLESLDRMGFKTPTPIQARAIPLAMQGKDILGSAQTGTGKTGAFAIPLVSKIMNKEIQGALVLTPTRELAVQVLAAIHQILGNKSNINTALLIGGESMILQFRQLRRNPTIIVGTPGRINDHLERQSVSFAKTTYLVLDETDRMLDMGFGHQIDSILEYVPENRQTLMFSATMPKNIMHMAAKYLKQPERIEIGSSIKPLESILQESIRIQEGEKYGQLVKELDTREGSVVIFVRTKQGAKNIADRLYRDRFSAQAIHGNLRQNKRDSVMQGFRDSKFRILVATDVAARGLDVPHIQHVINHDLPQCPEDYIHRIGRTARAGAKGSALNFITGKEDRLWRAIERFMKTGDQSEQNHYPRRDSGSNDRGGFKRGGFRKEGNSFGRSSNGGRSANSSGKKFGFGPRKNRDNAFGSREESNGFDDGAPRSSDRPSYRSSDRSSDKPSYGSFDRSSDRPSYGSSENKKFGNKNKFAQDLNHDRVGISTFGNGSIKDRAFDGARDTSKIKKFKPPFVKYNQAGEFVVRLDQE